VFRNASLCPLAHYHPPPEHVGTMWKRTAYATLRIATNTVSTSIQHSLLYCSNRTTVTSIGSTHYSFVRSFVRSFVPFPTRTQQRQLSSGYVHLSGRTAEALCLCAVRPLSSPTVSLAHCSAAVRRGVRYSATLSASIAMSIVAMPSGVPSLPGKGWS